MQTKNTLLNAKLLHQIDAKKIKNSLKRINNVNIYFLTRKNMILHIFCIVTGNNFVVKFKLLAEL